MKKVTLNDLEDAMDKLEDVQHKFLIQKDWISTCQSPDCSWYWVKEFDGKRWTGDTYTAISMQTSYDTIHGIKE